VYGVKIPVETDLDIFDPKVRKDFADKLVGALKDIKWQGSVRPKMMEWARKNFTWSKVAKQWDKEFKDSPLRDAANTILEVAPQATKYLPVQLQEELGYEQTY